MIYQFCRRYAFPVILLLTTASLVDANEYICRYCGNDHSALAAFSSKAARKYAPDRLVDVRHIKIDVTPNFEQRTVSGTTTLSFAPISKPVEQLTLNAVKLDISHIESSAPLADWVLTDERLTLLFARPLEVGEEAEVAVTYSAEPKEGLYFRTPELGYPAEDTHLWTQGETHGAPHWFPCFDYPNERATTEVICTVPDDMLVASNGRMVGESTNNAGLKTVHWLQDKPHASYLVCLVAGKFHVLEDKHRDIPLRFLSQPSLAEHAANSFQDTREIMAFYEAEIGVPFPWDKYDQVTIRDFLFGGMENTTLTTLTHATLWSEETENIYSSRNLDAHELAHQWFGDYVTCEDWSQLWLNEGFATYYTHLYNEHKLGRDALLYGLWKDAADRVLPQADNPRPIVYRGYHSEWEQFDFRAYPKGSWVLHMLRCQLGKELYRAGIKHYLDEHGQSSVVTADLQASLEEVSGRELDRFFDQWVYRAGTPKLKVRYEWLPKERLARVVVEQTHKVDDNTGLFEIPTKLRFIVDGQPMDHPIKITKQKHEFYVPLSGQPTLVRFDPEYTVLAEVDFKKPQAMLRAQLEADKDMIGRLLAANALAKDDSQKNVEALQSALNNDSFYGIRIQAARALASMDTDEAFEALSDSLDQSDARVRQATIEQAGKFDRPQSLEILQQVIDSEPNPAIVATAVTALSNHPGEEARRQIELALERECFQNRIASAAILALGETGDATLRDTLLHKLQADREEFGPREYAQALKALGKLWRDADDTQPARRYLESCLHAPVLRVGAIEGLGELGDLGALPTLQSYVDRGGRSQSAATIAVKKLQDDAPFVPQEVRQLRKQVTDLQAEQDALRQELDRLKAKAEAGKEPATTGAKKVSGHFFYFTPPHRVRRTPQSLHAV